jgi:hypothetical protein
VSQITLIEVKPIRICIPFGRLPVDYQNPWNLRKLSKNDLVFIFNSSDDSVFQKVSVSLILLTSSKFCEKLSEKWKLTINVNLDSTWCQIGGTSVDSNVWDASLSGGGPIDCYSRPVADYLGCKKE